MNKRDRDEEYQRLMSKREFIADKSEVVKKLTDEDVMKFALSSKNRALSVFTRIADASANFITPGDLFNPNPIRLLANGSVDQSEDEKKPPGPVYVHIGDLTEEEVRQFEKSAELLSTYRAVVMQERADKNERWKTVESTIRPDFNQFQLSDKSDQSDE